MELVDYLRVLRRRWFLVALATFICAGSALGASLLRTPTYETTAQLVVTGTSTGLLDEIALRQIAVSRAVTYASYASTRPAVDAAMGEAGYRRSGPRPTVTSSADGTTPFLRITATDTDPKRAAAVANAYVDSFLGVVAQLDGTERAIGNNLTVLEPAAVPAEPTSPKPLRDAAVGLVVGLVLGICAAFVRETLDRVYRDPDVLEDATRLSVLGVVPQELPRVLLPTLTHPLSGRAEAYRTVRTNIQFAGPSSTLRRILVTSATASDGKTSVATNLAVAFARTGQSVVLIDADMRRPQVARSFGLPLSGEGLSEFLVHGRGIGDLLHLVSDAGLAVLPSGGQVDNPSELLGSARMGQLLSELEARFDVVIIDSPPVLPVSDPLILAVNASGVVLVVRLGATSRERLRRALSSLRKLDVPVLGLVANGSVAGGDAAYGYGAKYGYESRVDRSRTSRRRRGRAESAREPGEQVTTLSAVQDQEARGHELGQQLPDVGRQ